MGNYTDWAARYPEAAAALVAVHAGAVTPPATPPLESEAAAQQHVRLQAAHKGWALYRNNVGSLPDRRGVPVRFGLCNESPRLNRQFKSSDLIGLRPVTITPAMEGRVLGQFVSIECKTPGWVYKGTQHEQAQLTWLTLINRLGGAAWFSTGELKL